MGDLGTLVHPDVIHVEHRREIAAPCPAAPRTAAFDGRGYTPAMGRRRIG
jgi:hypothetical protein